MYVSKTTPARCEDTISGQESGYHGSVLTTDSNMTNVPSKLCHHHAVRNIQQGQVWTDEQRHDEQLYPTVSSEIRGPSSAAV